jgi:membrane associated rhomboid family serine protease
MFPLRDLNPTRPSFRPYVTYALIALNVGVWLLQLGFSASGNSWLVPAYGVVPTRLMADPAGEAFTVLTSMFLHGGWAHLGGNLLFLFIFGDNVEDAAGHFRYLLFYLASGTVGAVAQVAIDPGSGIPMVGASGAIAGVLGAYMVLYPRAPVTVLNPIPLLWFVFGLFLVFPAWLVVGEWFAWNLLRGLGSIATAEEGGVAFFAHIGGFLAGILLTHPVMTGRRKAVAPRWQSFSRGATAHGGRWAEPLDDPWRHYTESRDPYR